MKFLLTIIFLLMTLSCNAAIYQAVDSSGNIVYSDQPVGQHSKQIDLHGSGENQSILNTSPSIMSTLSPTEPTPAGTPHSYNTFSIDTPKNLDTIQNLRSIPVEIKIDPALQEGDTIQLILDGKPWGGALHSPHLTLDQAERGTHQLSAVILDRQQHILKQSNAITIHVHLASSLNRP